MTDSEKDDGEGLPTAAYRWRDKTGVTQASINNPEDEWCDDFSKYHGNDELVRRSDVKALIQDRIDQAEEKVDKYNGLDKLNLKDAKARKQELKELLEEIKQ